MSATGKSQAWVDTFKSDTRKYSNSFFNNDPVKTRKYNNILRFVVKVTAFITVVIGLLVMLGWIFEIPFLKSLHPDYVSMKANTAIGFVFLGIAVLLHNRITKSFVSGAIEGILITTVVFISLISFLEYLLNWNSGIDELIFKDISPNNIIYPGRLAFSTCICFLLLSISLALGEIKIKQLEYLSQLLPVVTGLLSIVPIIGYLYGANELLTFAFDTNMALHTAITFLILGLGIIFLNPSTGFISILTDGGLGGFIARRLLPVTFLIPVLFIWLRLITNSEESGGSYADILIISFIYLLIFTFLILRIARYANSIESEQNLIQTALTQSEQRSYLIFHLSPAALAITNFEDGKIIDTNEAYCRLVGFSGNELVGKHMLELNIWVDPVEREKLLAELSLKGHANDREVKIRNSSGQIRYVLSSFEQINLPGGKCILSSAIDVTDRKLAQEAIIASEERFRSTLDNMMEGCQLLGFDWKYLYINDTAEKHNRRPKDELIGKKYMDMWPGITDTEVFHLLQDCMFNRVSHIIVNEFAFPDGTKGWFDLRIQPVPEGVFILSTDITERKQAESYNMLANEILECLNRFTDSEQMITQIINSIKSKTGYESIAIRLNEGDDFPYYKTSGFSDEFIKAERYLCNYDKEGNLVRDSNGDPLLECMCGNILSGRVDPSKSFFTEGGSFRSNNTTFLLSSTTPAERLARTRNRCNSFGYESVALIPLRSGNEIIGLLQLNDHRENIFTEEIVPFFERIGSSIGIAIMRNRAESQIKKLNEDLEHRVLERTGQLTESNKELESFAYSVSHDLRAPLRHVIGFSEKLESETKERFDPEITRLTSKIKDSASKMSRLIDELLTYSRLGRTDLNTIKLSLNQIVDEIINEAHDIISDRNIRWEIHKLPDIKTDPTLIKLVFQNLIHNSIKFTGKKRIALIEINVKEETESFYTIYIKDNGAGFSMNYADKLFGVFQRLHSTGEFEGTGIGLATVKRLIKRLGGDVWAEGEENKGATFYFTIPK